jgi:trehalose synthase
VRNVSEVHVEPEQPDRFRALIGPERYDQFQEAGRHAAERLGDATVWNVNSTARGGGVAEMLQRLVGYARGGGIDARWLVVEGEPDFFEVTKRIHNRLHGSTGDGGPLDDDACAVYQRVLQPAAADLADLVKTGDVVVLHDPQTAGLIPAVRRLGARAVWRCHVGTEVTSDLADEAWAFLLPFLAEAEAYVFSRAPFVWRGLDARRVHVIAPSIDAFSTKNRDLDQETTQAILAAAGVIAPTAVPDGRSLVGTRARMVEDQPIPPAARVVTQVSRWDRLKDPVGVIHGFAAHVAPFTDGHLVVAGPSSESVTDDPEGAEVLEQCVEARDRLAPDVRARVHLACLPMADAEENALMVNALQRQAAVVVQKSLAEGFGLTVAEAMWKARPVVASRVGGIQDQIDDGRTGLLVDDPTDLAAFGAAVRALLEQPERAEALGLAAREAIGERFLAPRHLRQYAELVASLVAHPTESPAL